MNLHEKLKYEREKKGYSLGELSKLTGLNRAILHKYELGIVKNIPTEKLLILANIYRKDPNYFILDQDNDDLIDTAIMNEEEEENKKLLSSVITTVRIYMEKMNIPDKEIEKFLKKLYKFLIKNMQ